MGKWNYQLKKLAIPYYPAKKDEKRNPYDIQTIEYKTISKYLNISIFEVDELDIIEFKFYLREAFIYNCSMTAEGIEYLINAKRLETTKPEMDKLRELKKKMWG